MVRSVTSVSRPPITPASAIGPLGSAITSMLALNVRFFAVQRNQALAEVGAPDDDIAVRYLVVVEGVKRLPILQHHVVCDVHDVIDGAHARRRESILHPARRRADCDVDHDACGIARAELRLLDVHAHHG